MYAETQLKKCDGWEKVIKITDSKENNSWTDFAKYCGVVATPTLVAIDADGEIVARISGSQDMTSDFWKSTIQKHRLDQHI